MIMTLSMLSENQTQNKMNKTEETTTKFKRQQPNTLFKD